MSISASAGFEQALSTKLHGIAELSASQLAALRQHYELLLRWNQRLNLTRITGLPDAVERHYAESIFLAAHLPKEPLSIADLGSGGGFPGIPIAVYRPDCRTTLIESHSRKAVFLKEASRGLPNVSVFQGRAEKMRGGFDWVVSRAVSVDKLSEALLARLGRNAAVLGSIPLNGTQFAWRALALPWGERKKLYFGVSRETTRC